MTGTTNLPRAKTILAFGAAVAVVLSGCSSEASVSPTSERPAQKAQVLLTTSTWNVAYAPFVIAKELGYYGDVDVEYVLLNGSATVYQQLAQGHGDVAVLSPEPIVICKEQGQNMDLTYFSSFYRESIWGMAVPEGSPIKTISDLKGKNIGVASIESGGVYAAKAVLKDAGINPDTGVKYLAIGSGGQAVTAVKGGQVDALSLFDSQYASLENAGIKLRMLDTPKLNSLTSGGLVAKKSRLGESPELFTAVARGIAEASLFAATNPKAAVTIMWKSHPETKPKDMSNSEAMAQSVRMLQARMDNVELKSATAKWGDMTEKQWANFVDFTKDAGMVSGNVDPRGMFTTSLIAGINDFDSAKIQKQAQGYLK